MKLEQVVQCVESRLFNLGRKLLQADEKADLLEELDLVQVELDARQAAAACAETARDAVRQRIQTRQQAAQALAEQIASSFQRGKSSQAVRQALELEHLRRDLAADETELAKREQTVWSLHFTLRSLRRRLARMNEQLGKGRI